MKTRLFLVLLACVSSIASAEWTQLGATNQGNASYFLDLSTRQKAADGKVTIAYLFDMKTPREADSKPYVSMTGQDEFDCNARQYRSVTCARYSAHMATGEVVSEASEPEPWSRIPPHSKLAHMFKVACAARPELFVDAPSATPPFDWRSGLLRRR